MVESRSSIAFCDCEQGRRKPLNADRYADYARMYQRCRARTNAGRQCRRQSQYKREFCVQHEGTTNVVSEEEFDPEVPPTQSYRTDPIDCSFCSRTWREVTKIIQGPEVTICDGCVELCLEILREDETLRDRFSSQPAATESEIDFDELAIMPRFNRRNLTRRPNHCFYLCPFSEPFDSVYSDHVKPLIEDLGLTIDRADEIYGTDPIIEDIWESICVSEIILADVTGRNPNVMYEIGMAHTVGKPVVILTQSIDDVPFDLRHYRCITYSYTPPGIAALEKGIAGTVRFISSR